MSLLEVNKITPQSGTTLTLGDTGDSVAFASGAFPDLANLTVTGDLTVDTNSLKVDSTNNRVGIGTASPSVALDVVGAITASGNITGTLATAAQPNITSLGTLTGLTTTGSISVNDNTLDGITAKFINSNAGNSGAEVLLIKDSSSPADNDVVGTVSFKANDDGGTEKNFASIQSVTIDATASSSSGDLRFSTRGSNSVLERMRINGSGNVGIGTSSPSYSLEVLSGSASTPALKAQCASGTSATTSIFDAINGGGNIRLRVQNDGDVGIGTSSPTKRLHIKDTGSSNAKHIVLRVENADTG